MELYKKYRPSNLDEIIGNASAVKILKGYEKTELPHALLFTGPPGCGKTTMGRIVKTMLDCSDTNFIELDSAVFRGIDTIRTITHQMSFKPLQGSCRVWLMDECHQLGTGGSSSKNAAQTALLKSLEDTPSYVYFILCTTNPEMLIPTVKDRCTTIQMFPLSDDEMGKLLMDISEKEGCKLFRKVKEQIVLDSEGHPRRALKILEKVLQLDNMKLMLKAAKEEGHKVFKINELCLAMLKGQSWDKVSDILKGLKNEAPETIRQGILGYVSNGIINKWALNYTTEPGYILSWFYDKNTYDTGMAGIIFCCYCIVNKVESPYI